MEIHANNFEWCEYSPVLLPHIQETLFKHSTTFKIEGKQQFDFEGFELTDITDLPRRQAVLQLQKYIVELKWFSIDKPPHTPIEHESCLISHHLHLSD